ncbi:hypothetical protein D9M68_905990 [compost metagenome]
MLKPVREQGSDVDTSYVPHDQHIECIGVRQDVPRVIGHVRQRPRKVGDSELTQNHPLLVRQRIGITLPQALQAQRRCMMDLLLVDHQLQQARKKVLDFVWILRLVLAFGVVFIDVPSLQVSQGQ